MLLVTACGSTTGSGATPAGTTAPVQLGFCAAVTAVSQDVTPLGRIDATSPITQIKPVVAQLVADFDVLDRAAPSDIAASVHPVRVKLDAANTSVQGATTGAGAAAGLDTITTALNSTTIGPYVTAHCRAKGTSSSPGAAASATPG